MRYTISVFLLLLFMPGFGQKNRKFSLLLQAQPELTFHRSEYGFPSMEERSKTTVNIGLSASIQYQLTKKLFLDVGLGFISRKLKTGVYPEASLLPLPYYDSTGPFSLTKSVSLRTLQLPVGIGYRFLQTKNANLFFKGAIAYNYILSTYYKVLRYPSFNINHRQGYSINVGVGFDYSFNKKIRLTNSLTYSLYNSVKKDEYIFSKDGPGIALTHTYLQLSTGIKINL